MVPEAGVKEGAVWPHYAAYTSSPPVRRMATGVQEAPLVASNTLTTPSPGPSLHGPNTNTGLGY